jgi:hypothetical protein
MINYTITRNLKIINCKYELSTLHKSKTYSEFARWLLQKHTPAATMNISPKFPTKGDCVNEKEAKA